MKQSIKDTAVLGTTLWLIGYLASLVLFFSPYAGVMGWILLAVFTPVTIVIVLWWFRKRERLPLQYYAGVGIAWVLIAIVLDYLFIVLLFHASYYGIDVFVYYAVTFLIPVGVGLYLNRSPELGDIGMRLRSLLRRHERNNLLLSGTYLPLRVKCLADGELRGFDGKTYS